MFPLFYQFMTLEEFDTDLYPAHEEQLLQIRKQGEELVPKLLASPGAWLEQYGRTRRRSRWHMLPFGGRRQRIWYLNLYHPLWLAEDGKVYRGYESLTGSSYFMEAELHLRDAEGLERVSVALERLGTIHQV